MALEKAWHKRCLKCAQCQKVLDPGAFSDRGGLFSIFSLHLYLLVSIVRSDSSGKLYCKFCYSAVAGLKGYGYGALNESHVSGGAVGVQAQGLSSGYKYFINSNNFFSFTI